MVLSEVAVDTVAVEDEARFRDLMQAHHYLGAVPGMGETVRGHICMYTNSPDAHFIVDRHSGHAAVAFAGGFSGYGFKFSTVVGEILTALTMDRPPATESNLARLERLTADQLPAS